MDLYKGNMVFAGVTWLQFFVTSLTRVTWFLRNVPPPPLQLVFGAQKKPGLRQESVIGGLVCFFLLFFTFLHHGIEKKERNLL